MRAALSEISAVTGLTGAGAPLADGTLIDGVNYRPLGQHRWSIAPNGKAGVNSIPIAEYRAMTGDLSPPPPGHQRSDVVINVAPAMPMEDSGFGELKETEPHAGLRRTTAVAYPDTSPDILWLPAPYKGVIVCSHGAIGEGGRCQLRLNRGKNDFSLTLPASELTEWRQKVVAFEQLMDRTTAN